MTRHGSSKPPHLAGLPGEFDPAAHVDPTLEHREASDAFLRGAPVDHKLSGLLDRVVAHFGWAETQHIEQAREQGDQSRVWDTAVWIIANAIAREERQRATS
jgi:hypothetical protein